MSKIPCSVGILTFNSDKTLMRAIKSVKDFAEIIICDGGSFDQTLKIAREYGCKIIYQDVKFKNLDNTIKDFSGVRNQCLNESSYDWFFYIDADEMASKELIEEIGKIVETNNESFLIYKIPFRIILDGELIEHASSYPGYQTRFFNRKIGARFVKPIHEKIKFDPEKYKIGTLKSPWFVVWDNENERIRDFNKKAAKYIKMEIERNKNQSFVKFIRWAIIGNLLTIFKIFLKVVKNLIFYGPSHCMPFKLEYLRMKYHFLLIREFIKVRFKTR